MKKDLSIVMVNNTMKLNIIIELLFLFIDNTKVFTICTF